MLLNDKDRLNYIKKEFSEMRRLYSLDEWQKGDEHLYKINDNGHLKWLIEQVEKLKNKVWED